MEGTYLPILVAAAVMLMVYAVWQVIAGLADPEGRKIKARLSGDGRQEISEAQRRITLQQEVSALSGTLTQISFFDSMNRMLIQAYPEMTLSRFLLTAAGIGFGVFLALWWAAIALLVPPGSFLARFAPDDAFFALIDLLSSGQLTRHITASLQRILVGLALAAAIGLPLGLALGSFRLFGKMSGPLFQFVRMISPLSWTPLAIILFGVGDEPVYFLIAIGAMWPIVLNTAAGVATLDPGSTAKVEIIRDGHRREIEVALSERRDGAVLASVPQVHADGKLGLDVQDLTAALAEKFKLKETHGVLVSKVDRGTLAHAEGLREGDLIKEVNRTEVNSVGEFTAAVARARRGESLLLRVIRESRAFYVVLKTG